MNRLSHHKSRRPLGRKPIRAGFFEPKTGVRLSILRIPKSLIGFKVCRSIDHGYAILDIILCTGFYEGKRKKRNPKKPHDQKIDKKKTHNVPIPMSTFDYLGMYL